MDDNSRIAESKNAQGKAYYKSGQYSNALYMYEIAIKLSPNTAKYYANRSACYLMSKNYIKAQADAQKAIDIDQKYLKGYLRIITCCLYDGNFNYALSTLLKAQKNFPEEQTVQNLFKKVNVLQDYYQKYETVFAKKKYSEALNFIEKCLSEESNCKKFMLAKGNCLIRLKEFAKAEKIANEILATNKNDENAIFVKTCAQCYQQDVHSALSLLKTVKPKLPDHLLLQQLYTITNLICNNIKIIEKAIENKSYKDAYNLTIKTLKIDPCYEITSKSLWKRRINIAQSDEELYWKGVLDCDEFMNLYGEDLNILHIKVKLLMKLEEYDDAVEVYTKILKFENNKINQDNLDKAKKLFYNQNDNDELLLRLTGKITKADIKKAAMELKRRYHTDKNPKVSAERKKQLEEKFDRITKAEKRLLDKF